MKSTDRPAFLDVITGVVSAFGKEPSTPMLHGYWLGLEDLALEDVQRAGARALRECKFCPTPRELRDLAGATAPISLDDRARIAWEVTLRAIRETSGWDTVDFDDRAINATIRSLGGWVRLSGLASEELHRFVAREFASTYRALAQIASSLAAEVTAPLIGERDASCEPEHRHKLAERTRLYSTGMPSLIAPTPNRPRLLGGAS